MLNIESAKNLDLPASPEAWVQALVHPTVIEIPGKGDVEKENLLKRKEWRIVTTLLHGNEPSGFKAMFKFLNEGWVPKTNMAFIIASVRAARHETLFTHRFMPGEFDLNRRFGYQETHDRVTELARQITEYIRQRCPQFVVDMHNTSGKGPSFAVSVSDHQDVKKLAMQFTDQMVVTQLVVGSLMEQNFNCPVVTIECGGAVEEKSHAIAYDGLRKLAELQDVFSQPERPLTIYRSPVRIRAHLGISLNYGWVQDEEVDITLVNDIEKYNSEKIQAGTCIGWIDRVLGDCLTAVNDHGEDIISHFFDVVNGQLLVKENVKIFMATSRSDIALSDCLFYASIS